MRHISEILPPILDRLERQVAVEVVKKAKPYSLEVIRIANETGQSLSWVKRHLDRDKARAKNTNT